MDNFEDIKEKDGNVLNGNYLCATTLQKNGDYKVKVLTKDDRFEKTNLYNLFRQCYLNENNEFVTYAYKKKKEDVRFTIKF